MAGYYDLHLQQNTRYKRGFKWKTEGVPRSFSGYAWKSQIRQLESIDAPLILDITDCFTLSDDTLSLNLVIPATDLAALDVSTQAYWDIFIWPTGQPGEAFPFLQGRVDYETATTDLR